MKANELDAAIEACLDDWLSEAEAEQLSQLLEDSAEARERYWEMASIHGLLEQSLQSASLKAATREAPLTSVDPKRFLRWSPVAAAVGMMVGVLSTAAVFGFLLPKDGVARPSLVPVVEDAFEDPSQTFKRGMARHANEWFVHGQAEILKPDSLKPFSGEHVLKLAPNPERKRGQVHYLIDLRDYPEVLESEQRFIRVASQIQSSGVGRGGYAIRIGAFAELPEEVGAIWANPSEIEERALQQVSRRTPKNDNQTGWQELTTDMSIPEGTRTVIVGISASLGRNEFEDSERYLDAVTMNFFVEPADSTSSRNDRQPVQ